MKICKKYRFSAGHFLPYVADGHPCKRQHGHNYGVDVIIAGEVDRGTGMVMDFADIDTLVKPVIAALDHRNLNDILDNPTAEHIAGWIYAKTGLLENMTVRVWETENCYAETCAHEDYS